jgi:formate hydrogenlyase transcriptional activator
MKAAQGLIGSSPKFRAALRQVEIVAPARCAVLLQGETGTGKELFARAIHEQSPRRSGPFVKINCAAIPSGLLESELFGHDRGAYTGALTQTVGRFQLADRGTLFLDEIGDLVAATHQNLTQMVDERRYRADLFYRLNVFPIALPSLRERHEDIPVLVRHFVRHFAEQQKKQIEHVPDEVMALLQIHEWPGNIRELQNFVERSVLLTTGRSLHVPLTELRQIMPSQSPEPVRALAELERAYISQTLIRTGLLAGSPAPPLNSECRGRL